MSKTQFRVARRVVSILTATATAVTISGSALVGLAVAPSAYGLTEGDVISSHAQTGDPDVKIINEHGYGRLFLNPQIFNLYGHLGFDKVKNVSKATYDAFPFSGLFRNCESGDQRVWGLESVGEDVANLHWVNVTGAQAVAQDPNFFKKVFCINNNEQALYGTGSDYTSLSQVPDYSRMGGPAVGGALSASLSSDNPVGGTIIAGQAIADLLHVTFAGNGSVTNIKFKRMGVSSDNLLSAVYLYDGANRLVDSATVTDSIVTFNDLAGLFSVAGSRNIALRANILSTAASGQTVQMQLQSYTVGGVTTNVSFTGNSFTTASLPSDFATADFGAETPAAGSVDPQDQYTMFQSTLTIGNKFVWLKGLKVRMIGSVAYSDLQNFHLLIDGVDKGSVATLDAQGYLNYDFSANPVRLETGGRVVKVLGDIKGGSSKNFKLSVRQASDILLMDSQYGQYVLATGTGAGGFPVEAGQQDVNSGTLTFTKKTDSPAGDVVKDASGAVLGRWEVKANGERVKIENLRANFAASSTAVGQLRNGAIYANGAQIGSTQTLFEDTASGSNTNGYTEYNLGSSLIVDPLAAPTILELRADVYDNGTTNSVAANQTIQGSLAVGSSNAQRLVSLNYINAPTGAVTANVLTVKTGSFTAGKYTGYNNQQVVSPQTLFKLGHFVLTAASSENVNVNTVNLDFIGTGTFTVSKVRDVYLKIWDDTMSLRQTTTIKATVTASNSYSVNFTLPQNKSWQVEVWGNIDAGITAADTMKANLDASGVTANSSTTAQSNAVDGQIVTIRAGVLTTQRGSVPAAKLAYGGSTAESYRFTLQPTFDDFTLEEIYVDLSSTVASSTGAIAVLHLKKASDGMVIGAASVNSSTGSASFTGLNFPLPQSGSTQEFILDVQLAGVGVGGNDTGGVVNLRLDGLKYHDGSGNVTTSNGLAPATFGGNSIVLHKSYPTFSNVGLPSTVLNAGQQTLFKTQLGVSGGNIGWRQLIIAVNKSSTAGFLNQFKIYEDGSDITSSAVVASSSAAGGSGNVTFTFASERSVSSGGRSIEIKANVYGTLATGDSVSTQIANPNASSPAIPATFAVAAATSGTFVWTDSSSPSHSGTTDDWMTDGLLKIIGSGQSLNK